MSDIDAVMSEGESDDVRESKGIAQRFESFLAQVQLERNGAEYVSHMRDEMSPFNVVQFVDSYVGGGVYPIERLKEATLRAVDVRLQLEYVHVDAGLANVMYHGPLQDIPELGSSARYALMKLALDQSLIGRVRIAWEKFFRLVHNLETGKDEVAGRSVKGSFFKWIATQSKWRFLEPYEKVVEEFDRKYRTPEYHKHSVLRGQLLKGVVIDDNEYLTPFNYLVNTWPNVLSILKGGKAVQFTDLHEIERFKINPRYLEDGSD